jgi:hypothetical protein
MLHTAQLPCPTRSFTKLTGCHSEGLIYRMNLFFRLNDLNLEVYVYLITSWVTGRNFSTAIKLNFLEARDLPVLSSVFWKLKELTVLGSRPHSFKRQGMDHVLHVGAIYRRLALLTIKYETLPGKRPDL